MPRQRHYKIPTGKSSLWFKRVLSKPVIFGENVISTLEDELNATFTADGKTIYFSKNSPGNLQGVIVYSDYKTVSGTNLPQHLFRDNTAITTLIFANDTLSGKCMG